MNKVINKLTDLMQQTQFEHELTINPNINQQKLSDIIETSLKEIPSKKVKITKYNTKHSPWITQGLLNSIKKRDSLYKQFIKTKPESPSYEIKKIKLKYHKILLKNFYVKQNRNIIAPSLKSFQMTVKIPGNY